MKTSRQSTKPVSTKTAATVLSSNERQKQSGGAKKSNATTDKNTEKKSITKKPDSHAGVGLSSKTVAGTKSTIKTSIKNAPSTVKDNKSVNKKNVMNTIHNVTVSSPPASAGKERSTSLVNIRGNENNDEGLSQPKHSRSRTRTIAPEESILLQRKLAASQSTELEEKSKVERKNPVAYEINFEEEKKLKKIAKKSESNSQESFESVVRANNKKPLERQKTLISERPKESQKSIKQEADDENKEDDEDVYESDFESYESDFEAEPSDETTEKSSTESDDSDDMEVTKYSNKTEKQPPERVDSGSFDMSAKKSVTPSLNQYDSIDDTVNSHDSGISYDDLQALNKRLLSPKVKEFYRRGEELMKKITFDNINFDIFEQKPVPYEVFMSIYGQRGMMQASTQSESFTTNEESQTDGIRKINSWTQYPSKFTRTGLENVNSKLYNEEKLGVGDETFEYIENDFTDSIENIDMSIEAINNFSNENSPFSFAAQKSSHTASDLRNFIQNASMTILNILEGSSSKSRELTASKIPISHGQFEMRLSEIECLKNTSITKIWSNLSINNYLITVHKATISDQNIMCLWNILHTSRPIKIFSSWCDIKCIEIHPEQRDFIIAGCDDGTICLWNIQESTCSDDFLQPCEIISLNQVQNDFSLDNVVALKSLSHRANKNTISMFTQSHSSQFCSLHVNGFLSIWTLLRIDGLEDDVKRNEMDFTYNGSQVKLIKNMSIDLNSFLNNRNDTNSNEKVGGGGRRKSAFEKTRYYFENDLFSDKVLKELQEIDTERLQRSKNFMYRNETFTAISFDLNFNELFIASDANFIVAMSRLCLGDRARKIITSETNFISPSVIRTHPIDRNILAIGQSNGSVKFIKTMDELNENSLKRRKQLKRSNAAFSNDENVLAKSCAFQNIVEREKKLYDETQALNNLATDELKAFMFNDSLLSMQHVENEENYRNNMKIAFDKNIFNSFNVSMGSVKLIEFNRTGHYMFVLISKELKIFDCWKNVEVQHLDNRSFLDVRCITCGDGNEYLVLLTSKKEVLVNKLKS